MRKFLFNKQKKAVTEKQVRYRTQKYFDDCEKNQLPPTITGLANYLGYNRRDLIKFKNRNKKVNEIVEFAKQFIEEYIEVAMFSGKQMYNRHLMFVLKNNFGWVESIHTENVNTNTKVVVKLDLDLDEDKKPEEQETQETPEENENE